MKKNQSPSACPVRAVNPMSKAKDIAYIRLGRRNLKSSLRYYLDFGLSLLEKTEERILFHGHGSNFPCWSIEKNKRDVLLGLGFYISSNEDFERLKTLEGAKFFPSGRFGASPFVNVTDPSGLSVDAVFSEVFEDLNSPEISQQKFWNAPGKTERINLPRPFESGPAKVIRLGHAVLLKQEFLKNAQWYCDTFGLIPSDIQILPGSKEPVIVFLRCDGGDKLTDHHTIVIANGIDDRLEHCAFELEDLDEVAKGREWLLGKGWKSAWGIGRHLLGSQIFDYHRDPTGMLVEHYSDGDKFDETVPVGYHWINRKSLYQWGEDMPKNFLDLTLSFHKLKELLKGIFSGKEISMDTLLALQKTMKISPRNWIKY